MLVRNVHERVFRGPQHQVGALIDSLGSERDRLWPDESWPALRLDAGPQVASRGGHGPVRYVVEAYEPARAVVFRFTEPKGFRGTHSFRVRPVGGGLAALRHELEMEAAGPAFFTWPLFFRPLHDALLEDLLDKAELALLGRVQARQQWSAYVRVLRWTAQKFRRRNRGRAAGAGSRQGVGGAEGGEGV